MSESDNFLDLLSQLSTPRYAPRLKPTTIPTARWNEEPLLCLKVNDQWVSHLLGVIVALDQGDTWLGTPDQIRDARQQVNEIMLAFMEDCDPMSNCCPEPNRTRFNDDGTYEISYDGGVTWQDGSDFDPRYTSPQFPPLPGDPGSAKKCDAANSVLVQVKDKIEGFHNQFAIAGSAIEFVSACLTIIVAGILVALTGGASLGFFIPLIIASFSAIWNIGADVYDGFFTELVYDDLLCIVYCHVSENGTFDDAAISAIISDCYSKFTATDPLFGYQVAADAFAGIFKVWGAVGTTNAASIGGGGEDCDDCNCDNSCPATWSIFGDSPYHGTIVDMDEDWIEIQSGVLGGGVNAYVLIRTETNMDCCRLVAYEITAGSFAGGSIGWANCGETPVEGAPAHGGNPFDTVGAQCINYLQMQAPQTFTVKLHFAPCE